MKRRHLNSDLYPEVIVKMARIEEVNTSIDLNDKSKGAVKEYSKEAGKVIMKEYILNDLKALEKKWKMRNVVPVKVSKEATNGSSIHVDLKTSLFEE